MHELAHYLTAIGWGAADVSFHWAYVDHNTSSVSGLGNAAIAFAGPVSSYLMILVAWNRARTSAHPFSLGLGFAAAVRCLAVLPFTIRSLLGRDTSTFFFDEIRGAEALDLPALVPALITLGVGVVASIAFARLTYRRAGLICLITLVVGTIAGAPLWAIVGGALFPGGAGFN